MNENLLNVGRRIRELREERGMTQQELAEKAGYKSKVSISKIELQRDLPFKKIVPIANALGIAPDELLGWNELKRNPKMKAMEALINEDGLITDEEISFLINRMENNKEFYKRVMEYAEFLWERMKQGDD